MPALGSDKLGWGEGDLSRIPARRIADDDSDDNADDSCTPDNAHDCPKTVLSCLVTHSAWSWQCEAD